MKGPKSGKHRENQAVIENNELSIWEALIPVIVLVGMLAYNVYVFGDDALKRFESVHFTVGRCKWPQSSVFEIKVPYKRMLAEVAENVKSTTGALLILLMVGALAWLPGWSAVSFPPWSITDCKY